MKDSTLKNSVGSSASKWRVFVDAYINNGFDKTSAAVEAGYPKEDASSVASYLLTKPEIARLIRKKQQEISERFALTTDAIIEMYEDAFLMAKEARNVPGMVAATEAIAKVLGLVLDKKSVEMKTTNETSVTVRQPELEDRLRRLKGEIDDFLR